MRHRVLAALLLVFVASSASAQGSVSLGGDVQSATSGSVPAGEVTPGEIALTLKDALERGLRWNFGVVMGRETIRAANGQRLESRSGLLPHLSLTTDVNVQQLDIRAQEGLAFPGLPSVIGPFGNFDARLRLTQSIVDVPAILRARASNQDVQATEHSYRDVREQVVVAVGTAYLQTAAYAARLNSAQAERATAVALHEQARDRLMAGTAAAIDVLRAHVQVQEREQQVIAARNDLAKQKLALARLIGLPLGQAFAVATQPLARPMLPGSVEEALRRAYSARADHQSLLAQVRSFELRRKAASAGYLPALSLSLDYGAIGVNPASVTGTVGGFVGLAIPLFQRGRVRADVAQADAALAQRRAGLENLRGQIEQEVRSAFLDLASAAEQLDLAKSLVELAGRTLEQARDRFAAGVSDNIEVVQAQQTVASATETLIVSDYQYNVAAFAIARATGSGEASLANLVEGR